MKWSNFAFTLSAEKFNFPDILMKTLQMYVVVNVIFARENGNKGALEVLSCLRNMQRLQEKITWNLLVLVYRGSKRKEVLAKPFNTIPEFGKGKTVFTENSLKHFIQVLISENVVTERLRGAGETKFIPYLACGNKEGLIKTGELLIWRYKM